MMAAVCCTVLTARPCLRCPCLMSARRNRPRWAGVTPVCQQQQMPGGGGKSRHVSPGFVLTPRPLLDHPQQHQQTQERAGAGVPLFMPHRHSQRLMPPGPCLHHHHPFFHTLSLSLSLSLYPYPSHSVCHPVPSPPQDEVLLEFHVDDTADDREDTLVEMAFHVPPSNTSWGADGQQQQAGAEGEDAGAAVPAAKVRVDMMRTGQDRTGHSRPVPAC